MYFPVLLFSVLYKVILTFGVDFLIPHLVCYTDVFSVVTQRSSSQWGGGGGGVVLRHDSKNGYIAD